MLWSLEAVRFYTASLCLAFSPGKGSFTVIETPLPQVVYTHTHTQKRMQVLGLAGRGVGKLFYYYYYLFSVAVFLFLCIWFMLPQHLTKQKSSCYSQTSVYIVILVSFFHTFDFGKSCICLSLAASSGVTPSLKVTYEKTRERERRQEVNEGAEVETWDGQTSPGGGAGCLGAMGCHSLQEDSFCSQDLLAQVRQSDREKQSNVFSHVLTLDITSAIIRHLGTFLLHCSYVKSRFTVEFFFVLWGRGFNLLVLLTFKRKTFAVILVKV